MAAANTTTVGGGGGAGSPCGACKFLRRKCATDCIFAPYFCSEQGPARFAAIHKVFGASNVSKLLLHVPVPDRCEAVVTIAYEAQARIRDPVYGCVAHIFALQQQVAFLQAQLMQLKAQMANNIIVGSQSVNNNLNWAMAGGPHHQHLAYPTYANSSVSPQSSIESVDNNHSSDHMLMQEMQANNREDLLAFQSATAAACNKKRLSQNDLDELQTLALRMMRNH